MPAKKFTQLPSASDVSDEDVIAIVQGGISKQAPVSLVRTGVVLWDFSANDGSYPTDGSKLYIAIDDSVIPSNTWFVSTVPTPSGESDFLFK